MERTKKGGAILSNGIKLNSKQFKRSRNIRDIFRVIMICIASVLDVLFFNAEMLIILGVVFLMYGWRLQNGW